MIYAVMMVRDEADVIWWTLEHLRREGIDKVIVADNGSVDETAQIVEQFDFAHLIDDPEVGYYQDRKMTALARMAHQLGAEWVLPCDADEIFYAHGQSVADFLRSRTEDVVMASVYDHIATYDDDPAIENPFLRIDHRRKYPQRMAKVAFRAHPDAKLHMGNHDVDRPGQRCGGLYARHYQYRSLDQMIRKLTNGREAYEASDLHPMYGTHWREGGARSWDEHRDEWEALATSPDLVVDPCPW